jgi:hypothetical protein
MFGAFRLGDCNVGEDEFVIDAVQSVDVKHHFSGAMNAGEVVGEEFLGEA